MLIRDVADDGPAHAAGLKPQMVVMEIDERPLDFSDGEALVRHLATLRPGTSLRLALGGQNRGRHVMIVAAEMPPDALRRWKANFSD